MAQHCTIFPSSCVVICLRADCSAASVKDEIYTVFTLVPGLELYQTLAVLGRCILHLTFMLHGVKDEFPEWGKGPICVEGAEQSLTMRSGKKTWTFQAKNQITLYLWPHLCMLRNRDEEL